MDALTPAIHTLHMSEDFAGLVIVAIAGNAVENVVGVQLAARNQPDFAISVIVNSSLQVALALTPVLMFASLLFSTHLTLVFPTLLALVLVISAILGALVVNDGESTWQEGVVLVGFYVVIAASFWWGRSASRACDARVGQRTGRRGELDLQAAPARADQDRLPAERGRVDRRRQAAPLAERADAPDDVTGRALGLALVGERRALADGPQVELPVRRHDEDGERAVDRRDERLVELRGGRPSAAATASA